MTSGDPDQNRTQLSPLEIKQLAERATNWAGSQFAEEYTGYIGGISIRAAHIRFSDPEREAYRSCALLNVGEKETLELGSYQTASATSTEYGALVVETYNIAQSRYNAELRTKLEAERKLRAETEASNQRKIVSAIAGVRELLTQDQQQQGGQTQ
jgi:hypothetical protein